MLIGESLNEPFISFNDSLPNDRGGCHSSAMGCRDAWNVALHYRDCPECGLGLDYSLFHRNGCSCVYCSNYASPRRSRSGIEKFPRSSINQVLSQSHQDENRPTSEFLIGAAWRLVCRVGSSSHLSQRAFSSSAWHRRASQPLSDRPFRVRRATYELQSGYRRVH